MMYISLFTYQLQLCKRYLGSELIQNGIHWVMMKSTQNSNHVGFNHSDHTIDEQSVIMCST